MQVYSEKITRIVEDISSLNLLEVSKAYKVLNLSTISHLMFYSRWRIWTVCWSRSSTFPTPPWWWLALLLQLLPPPPLLRFVVMLGIWPRQNFLLFLSCLLHGQGLQKISVFKTARTGLNLKSPQEEEEQAPQVIQTSFTVKLNKFDAAKKVADQLLLYWPVFTLMIQVAIIKEIKNLVEGMNLVQVWNTNFRHSVLFPSKICKPL